MWEGIFIDISDGTLHKAEITWRSKLGKNKKEAVEMTWAVNFWAKVCTFIT